MSPYSDYFPHTTKVVAGLTTPSPTLLAVMTMSLPPFQMPQLPKKYFLQLPNKYIKTPPLYYLSQPMFLGYTLL